MGGSGAICNTASPEGQGRRDPEGAGSEGGVERVRGEGTASVGGGRVGGGEESVLGRFSTAPPPSPRDRWGLRSSSGDVPVPTSTFPFGTLDLESAPSLLSLSRIF